MRWLRERIEDPGLLRAVHGRGAWLWAAMAIPSMLWWRNSVAYLVGISVYTVVVGHWAGWQSSRVEDKQQQALAELREIMCEMREAGDGLRRAGEQIAEDG